jgi:hypothetical protein
LDVADLAWVRWVWDLTSDFWAEIAEKTCKSNKQKQIVQDYSVRRQDKVLKGASQNKKRTSAPCGQRAFGTAEAVPLSKTDFSATSKAQAF